MYPGIFLNIFSLFFFFNFEINFKYSLNEMQIVNIEGKYDANAKILIRENLRKIKLNFF